MPFMHFNTSEIRRMLDRWQLEHANVAHTAGELNLKRAWVIGPVVALLNAVSCILFLVQWLGTDAGEVVRRWSSGLLLAHLGMGLAMGGCGFVAYRLRYAGKTALGKTVPMVLLTAGIVFAIIIVSVDQWVTPSITPFLIACTAAGLVMLLRPLTAAWIYLSAYGIFFYALGLTQSHVEVLLSNRINGLVAVVLGWALSVLLWRNFTTITLQHHELERTHTELQHKHKELQRLTRLDGLTGLYNRSTFVELTRQELARARRQGLTTTILLMDLDFFKQVNDTWGHPAGDAVLKNVATIAHNTVRSTDLVGRLGGEEFIILLPNTSLEAGRKLAEKLRANMQNQPTTWEKQAINTTVSIGLASTTASEERDFDHLYTHADKALYSAKQKGRNRVA
jgi:diguanylate cyclase (GGDEF)-like protein